MRRLQRLKALAGPLVLPLLTYDELWELETLCRAFPRGVPEDEIRRFVRRLEITRTIHRDEHRDSPR